jgi:nucleotide sugar dehydrogenase
VETAEMIKLIDNSSRDVSFSFSNEVARLCDKIGISAFEVIQSGKQGYPRTNLPLPGLVGGPCLIKDSYILAEGCRELGVTPQITLMSRRLNEEQPEEIAAALSGLTKKLKGFPKRPVISLLGIAFKGRPETDDLRGTMARPVFDSLKRHFKSAVFQGYDPVVSAQQLKEFGLKPLSSLESAMKGAHLVLILNNHPKFSNMPIESLSEKMGRPGLIYDFWNSFTGMALDLAPGVGYMALGSHGWRVMK